MRIVWTQRFRDELKQEFGFLRYRNPGAARQVIDRIIASSRRLREFPRSGRYWRLEGTWELIVPGLPYIVIYAITAEAVILLMLFHTSRETSHIH